MNRFEGNTDSKGEIEKEDFLNNKPMGIKGNLRDRSDGSQRKLVDYMYD